jgi:hypothetical protein
LAETLITLALLFVMAKLNKLFCGSGVGARVRLATTKIEMGKKSRLFFIRLFPDIFK